jgi:hypothetical protein
MLAYWFASFRVWPRSKLYVGLRRERWWEGFAVVGETPWNGRWRELWMWLAAARLPGVCDETPKLCRFAAAPKFFIP